MNPQEQNKPKAPSQGATASPPGMPKDPAFKLPGAPDKDRKEAWPAKPAAKDEKDAGECGTAKGSCSTK